MFTPRRKLLHHGTWVPFGASEMLMRAVAAGRADGAVLACDGIGTLVCHRPELIQGVGARMNGLFYTTPYEALVSRALGLGALIPAAGPGALDPLAGLKAAASAGMKSVGVTVAGPQAMLAGRIRRAAVLLGVEAVVMSVCNSGLSQGESMAAAEADILWGCAGDRALMDALEGRVLLQLGLKSPVFALTPAGVGLALSSTAGGAAPRADGGSLMGTDSELPEGAFAGTVGPVRVRLAEGVELPRSNGGTCAR